MSTFRNVLLDKIIDRMDDIKHGEVAQHLAINLIANDMILLASMLYEEQEDNEEEGV